MLTRLNALRAAILNSTRAWQAATLRFRRRGPTERSPKSLGGRRPICSSSSEFLRVRPRDRLYDCLSGQIKTTFLASRAAFPCNFVDDAHGNLVPRFVAVVVADRQVCACVEPGLKFRLWKNAGWVTLGSFQATFVQLRNGTRPTTITFQ